MSDQKVPQAPDYSPVINAYNAIAQHATTQGQNAYNWAKDQVANNQNLIHDVNSGNLDTSQAFEGAGKNQLALGQATAGDATNYLQGERSRFTDPNYVQHDMGAAEANTGQAFDAARNSNIQELESFGVNPGATRFAGLDVGVRLQKAAAQAAAGTTAANTDQAKADAANAGLLQQGNTETANSMGLASTGTGAAQNTVQNNLAGTASGANVLGTDLAWTGAQGNALSGATNAMNTGFNNQATSDKISNEASSGIGSAFGMLMSGLGKGGAFAPGGALAFADGGEVPDANQGGAIPDSASPSGGAVTDDIPAQAPGHPNIRLNGGEVIIPRDVAGWMGEKFFLDVINKARKNMPQGTAQQGQPKMGGQSPGPAVGPGAPAAYMSGGTIADFRHADGDIEDRRGWTMRESYNGRLDRKRGAIPAPAARPSSADDNYDGLYAGTDNSRTPLYRDAGGDKLDLLAYGKRRVQEGAVGQ